MRLTLLREAPVFCEYGLGTGADRTVRCRRTAPPRAPGHPSFRGLCDGVNGVEAATKESHRGEATPGRQGSRTGCDAGIPGKRAGSGRCDGAENDAGEGMRMGDSVTSVTSVEILTPGPHERRSPRILLEWREIEWAATITTTSGLPLHALPPRRALAG